MCKPGHVISFDFATPYYSTGWSTYCSPQDGHFAPLAGPVYSSSHRLWCNLVSPLKSTKAASQSMGMQKGSDTAEKGQVGAQQANVSYAAFLHGAHDIRFEPAPELGELAAGKVRLQVKAAPPCRGSHNKLACLPCKLPTTLQHHLLAMLDCR